MHIEPIALLGAKISIPIAVVLYIVSRFSPTVNIDNCIGALLLFGWLFTLEVCSAYEKLKKERDKDAGGLS